MSSEAEARANLKILEPHWPEVATVVRHIDAIAAERDALRARLDEADAYSTAIEEDRDGTSEMLTQATTELEVLRAAVGGLVEGLKDVTGFFGSAVRHSDDRVHYEMRIKALNKAHALIAKHGDGG